MQDLHHSDQTDISVVEYAAVLARQKWFVLLLTVGAVLGALAWSIKQPLLYAASTSIFIGRIDGRLAESHAQIKGKVRGDVYGAIIRSSLAIDEKRFPQIKAEGPEDTNLLLLSLKSSDREEALAILYKMNEIILAEHEGFVKNEKEIIEQDTRRLYSNIGSLEQEKKVLASKIQLLQEAAPYQQELGGQLVFFDVKKELEEKKREIGNLYAQINQAKRTLQNIKETKILKEPAISEHVVRPNLPLNAAVAGLGGALAGIILAFTKEWWSRSVKASKKFSTLDTY